MNDPNSTQTPEGGARPAVIFLHIPKTAGTSFHSLLSWQYAGMSSYWLPANDLHAETFQRLSDERRSQLRLLRGHMVFGLHELLPRPSVYISLVRDPVSRVVSYLNYGKSEAEHYRGADHWWINDMRNLTPEELLRSGKDVELENGQTRRIAGIAYRKERCTDCDLNRAIENIDRHFAVIGVSERFTESILAMKDLLHWTKPLIYEKAKVAGRGRKTMSGRVLELIREMNAFDLQLYEYCRRRFDDYVAAQRGRFAWRIAYTSLFNRMASPMIPAGRWLLKSTRALRSPETTCTN